jgi:hypothetical protein
MRATLMPNGMQMNVLDQKRGSAKQGTINNINVFSVMKGTVGADDLDFSMMMKGGGGDDGSNPLFDFGEESEDPEGQLVVEKGGGATNDLETGVIV